MRCIWILPLVLAFSNSVSAADAFDLLKFIPPQANTVAIINTQAILASPRSVKEGWAKMEHTEYLAGAVPLNPLVERMVLAKEINPDSPSSGGTLGVIPMLKPIDLPKLAKRIGGTETTVNGEPAVLSPTGVYYVKLGDSLLGSVRTDNKQEIGRWLRYVKTAKESMLTKPLNAAVFASPSSHITIAVDADDLFQDHEIDVAVALAKSIQTSADQARYIAKFFKGIKGIIFTANITAEGIMAKVKFESSSMDLNIEPDFVKAFAIETMGRHGAELQDMQTAKATKTDGGVVLAFQVSDAELGRVMSLVLPPAAIPDRDAKGIEVAPSAPNAQSTLKYFNAVNGIIDDLQKQNAKAVDYTKTALWHETAANKIEQLSMIGVDKKVIEYAQGTAHRLRMIADSLNGVPAKIDDLTGQTYALGYIPRRGLWASRFGGVDIQTNAGEIANKKAKVIKDDAKNREKIWAGIDGKRSEMREAIVEKYNVVPPEKK